ncbi:MAG: low molecular weight phosphotyrosine protein phosphatase [Phycisphaerales bacterium]|nr:low molecular weight phosphotyrosine protein phosphatase [Phycisphaerales bacterium]MCI0630700.1 low molecular weight phosphotyrosine protein phosphatase [Phycisphaerales bacterium]MCI0674851.1 low molecular weight phosphotyrosine protein phosphatase [Phycisphaerales bacterium]
MADAGNLIKVCFVCMGNICRSPLAASVFVHKAKQRGVEGHFEVESAGTGGWHAGEPPDARARRTAAAHGVPMSGTARQIKRGDFDRFDLLLCMDDENREHLLAMGAPPGKVRLLLSCDPQATCREVPDPYYGGPDGFERVYQLVDSACEALLDELLAVRR